MACRCFIIPKSVLDRFAADQSLPVDTREAFAQTASLDPIWRKLREAHTASSQARLAAQPALAAVKVATAPAITVFDCKQSTSLPGAPVSNPGSSSDATAKRAFTETTGVAKFYKAVFGRDSVDNAGKTLMSSVHYSKGYNNAFWNGNQMVYGDGDGKIFIDFTGSSDVIGHELTHGVTQYTAGLNYTNEPGGLNESVSDVFGSMFRQWETGQTTAQADWLIGPGIMGPAAKAKGYTCLRDMANPGAAHCLSPQPSLYKDYKPGMDPHDSSGIPNHAFYLIAMAIGGKSWEKAGQIWYNALLGAKKTTNFKSFANLTVTATKKLYPKDAATLKAVQNGWKSVGVL